MSWNKPQKWGMCRAEYNLRILRHMALWYDMIQYDDAILYMILYN